MSYALITGASSGIGYELAKLCAKNGHNVILVARRENKLIQLATDLEKNYKIKTLIIPNDLSQINSAKKIFDIVQEKSITVNYLINNAGFIVYGCFSETSWEDEQKMIQLQTLNLSYLTKLFLPGMLKLKKGGILNIGSTGSFVPGPYNAVYCATKSFILSFSEAIAEELSGTGVSVTTLCPGGTNTAFLKDENRNDSSFFSVMKASKVARIGYDALIKGKRVVIPGLVNKLQVFSIRFIPGMIVSKFMGRMMSVKEN